MTTSEGVIPALPGGDRPSAKFSNQVLENIYNRRSVRSYKHDPVPDEVLLEIIKAGTFAPTAMNQQLWRFAVVTGKADIDRYADRAKRLWQQNIGLKVAAATGIGGPGIARYAKMMKAPGLHLFHNAPALVFIYAPKSRLIREDCACAAENMMLAATSLGLGSCWIGLAAPLGKDRRTREELKVPEGYELMATLAFGYPTAEGRKAPVRNAEVLLSWTG